MSCFHDILLGRRRVEHYDHAIVSGRIAGGNMAGARKPFLHQSMFWYGHVRCHSGAATLMLRHYRSDLGRTLSFEAVGLVDTDLPTFSAWAAAPQGLFASPPSASSAAAQPSESKAPASSQDMPTGRGVIFYLQVRGYSLV